MATDAHTIPLLVTLGHAGDDSLNLRFPPEYKDEIVALLDENGIDHGAIMEFSAGTELAIEAVKVLGIAGGSAGGLAALASVIKTFVLRHDGKRVVLKDGEIEEIAGFSEKDIEKLLQARAAEQSKRDAEWKRVLENKSDDGDDGTSGR